MSWEEIPEIDLFSDGGADPNPGKGGFGVILSYKGRKKEFSQGYQSTTNNRMELMGVIFGLEKLKTKSIVNIYTDSRYVIDGITKGWAIRWKSNDWYKSKLQKAINPDLWERLLNLISEHENVTFHWVKGHDGHSENERCDELASMALNGTNLIEDIGFIFKEVTNNKPDKSTFEYLPNYNKVKSEGDLCKKCGVKVIRKETKKKNIKDTQTYYFEYYLLCPQCKTIYMIEEAKRDIIKNENTLF